MSVVLVLGEVARIDGMLDMVLAEMRATKAAGEDGVPIVITGDDAEALAALVATASARTASSSTAWS